MKYTYTAALLSFALATGTLADDCAKNCNLAFDRCEEVPGADYGACAKQHASCLGFDPYTASSYDTPTACAKGPPKPTGAPSVDACAKSCNSAFDTCEAVPGADFVACAKKHADCLGFDPYTATKFDTPTACAKGPTKPTGAAVPDECCKKCTADHEACKGAPGSDKATCEKKYSDCLGYNPFQGTWVQPTTCAKGSTKPGVNGDVAPVLVAGGSSLKPALAVLALGAVALF